MTTPAELNEDEFMQFALIGISQFRRYENLYFQYRTGLVDEDFWSGHRENIVVLPSARHAGVVER